MSEKLSDKEYLDSLDDKEKYFDRELSWLSFNYRVLQEAADPSVPLYERVKFLAIFSSNLDEFFRVRVAALRSIVEIDKKKINKAFSLDPKQLLNTVIAEVQRQQHEFGHIKRNLVIPDLKKNNILLYRDEKLPEEHEQFCAHYFKSKVLSYLQPIIMSKESRLPHLDNKALYFAIDLEKKGESVYAHLNIPSEKLPRFIPLPMLDKMHCYITLDDVIRQNAAYLFRGYKVKGCYSIKLNRDADLNIEDEFSGNLVKKIQKQITKRNLGMPSRFLYDPSIPPELLVFLTKKFDLGNDDLVAGGRYHNMHDLFTLPNPLSPKLENKPFEPITYPGLDKFTSIYEAIDDEERLLHFPYQSYDYVLRFFNEAAIDPCVSEIKATFYRVAEESFIVNALISAAMNGKKVTAFVEVKARFDEANNLKWAERMQNAGVNIIYSIPGLKVHAKVAMVKRRNIEGKDVNYAFFGTGNFNEKTAEIYADHGLFTRDESLCRELENVFDFLADNEKQPEFDELLVSQFNMKEGFLSLIDHEIENVKAGKKGRVTLKLNNLHDPEMIDKLYEASMAGVKVELIVRAINRLRAGMKRISENITVRRIVDRYLEHARIYLFHNDGNEDMYMGSADWMKRNLHDRVEVVFPLKNPELKAVMQKFLEIQLLDNTKATKLDKDQVNIPISGGKKKVQAQREFYKYLSERAID